jgi:hypothetical protein
MKFRSARLGSAQSLVALSVALAVLLSTHTFAFASLAGSSTKSNFSPRQTESAQSGLRILSATATATAEGVLLQWSTNSAADNLGFNVYRLKAGQRTRVNEEIIPGAVFAPGALARLGGGYSYSWFDRGGTTDSIYHIESVSLQGTAKTHEPFSPVTSKSGSGFAQTPAALNGANATESSDSFERYYPAAETEINSPAGAIEDQWAITAQTALKIAIKKDGWYRVTQAQMVAAGFNPTVDIRNLRLFVDAQEVAINTSQHNGPFGSSDYIEFYGRGLDTPTTDTNIYYLIADTTPGKRVRGQVQLDGDPTSTPTPPAPQVSPTPGPVLLDPIFYSWLQWDLVWAESLSSGNAPIKRESTAQEQTTGAEGRGRETNANSSADVVPDSVTANNIAPKGNIPSGVAPVSDKIGRSLMLPVPTKQPLANASRSAMRKAPGKFRKSAVTKKRKRGRLRRAFKPERNHAPVSTVSASVAAAPANFAYTAERKDRTVYFVTVLNGDAENWFGQVITFNASNPVSQTINTPNPDLTAAGTARLEIALQGVNQVVHQISIEFNGVVLSPPFSFFGFDPASGGHPVQVFNIPISQLHDGANTIRFILPAGGDVSIVDYVKLSYPHMFRADTSLTLPATQSLRFMLRGTQSVLVDGFSTPSVRLIDYTDPLNVGITRPASAPSGPGFAITVPTSDPPSKPQRLLYAIADGQFDQPAGLSLNQPSTLNQGILSPTINSGADFLVISHKNFIPSLAPLLSQRQSQGMTAAAVDVEDIYDEFSYGGHGPQAIKDFLSHASIHWVTKPRYVIFAGDASYDPRNYTNFGNFDFVPTKLVDATFNETASDDWLTDFHGDPITDGPDHIADIPVGRLPVRTVAEADLVISKIVNFAPANVPQTALLVADDPTGYFFNFEDANDHVQSLVTPSLTVQKAYRRLEVRVLSGTITTNSSSTTVTGTGTLFTTPTEIQIGTAIAKDTGEPLGTVASISSATSLTLTANATSTYAGAYGKQDDATARADVIAKFNAGKALVNYSGHGNVDVWTGAAIFTSSDATALTNGNKLSFVVVMDCLNGYFHDPTLLSLSEALVKAPNGGAVAAFASSGLTLPGGQHEMSDQLYTLIYGAQPIAMGDAIKIAKGFTTDLDVRSTWIFFGDPSMKIR